MEQNEIFLDNDKLYYKDKERLYSYSDIDDKDKSKELLLNDNDAFSQYTTMNRNLSVLRNKLHDRYDYTHDFGIGDIQGGNAGFVLITDGDGTIPYWAHPRDVAWGLKDTEIISNNDAFVVNKSTIDWDMFRGYDLIIKDYDVNRITVDDNINLIMNTRLILDPEDITKTGSYQAYMQILPTQLQLVNAYAGTVYVKDLELANDYTYIARTDRGDVVLKDVNIISDGINTTQIETTTIFNTVFSIYMFDINLGVNVYTLDEGESARNYRDQHINDIMFEDEYMFIEYTLQECDGSLLEFALDSYNGCSIREIRIELYTNELLGE
jgi:hypothetical protein